ncbi:MAG: tRNA pseudouridine(55) synthase TruB [Clostridia bacterium]|nr:tRNA pseudouridine(55) synthase TruB [Clostridia bacterium]
MPFEGIVSVLKPPGLTSSDVVVDIRRIFGEKRVGHTGTLDPAAAGVLPICIGRATRLFDYLVDKEKEYVAEIRFGAATDTEDAFGTVTETAECDVSEAELAAVLPAFLGEIDQVPPIYSSLSLNGVKMYKLARRGEVIAPVEERRRKISISALEIVEKLGKNSYLLRIRCSKGTYIRTLLRDIGRAAGHPAYMAFLLRTQSGKFGLDSSFTVAELRELKAKDGLASVVMPMDEAVSHIPALELDGLSSRKKRLLINGAPIPFEGIPEKSVRRLYLDGEFMGLAERSSAGLHITVWLGDEAYQTGEKPIVGASTGEERK